MKKGENKDKQEPGVYKTTEFNLMLDMIEAGIWRTTNLGRALHLDLDTITRWKRKKKAIAAHRKAILKFVKRRTDVEKILKELDLESDEEVKESHPLVIIKDGDKTIEVAN